MNDQERITDFLNSEKKMSLNYGIFASECGCMAIGYWMAKVFLAVF